MTGSDDLLDFEHRTNVMRKAAELIEAGVSRDPTRTRPNTDSVSRDVISDLRAPLGGVPWTLEQFFKNEIDLDSELINRFPNMPLMTEFKTRRMKASAPRGVANLASQDGSAMVVVDASAETRVVQFSYTFGSMLTLRFVLDTLNDMERRRWLDLMHRKSSGYGIAFLWGQARWQHDYVMTIRRSQYTTLLAYSPRNHEAAVRMSPGVTRSLVQWLEGYWKVPHLAKPPAAGGALPAGDTEPIAPITGDETPPPLLTW